VRKSILSAASAAAIAFALAAGAQAADAPPSQDLTWNGITLYGAIDVGISYQTHGAPLSDSFYPGAQWLISNNSNKSQFNVGPGGLYQSRIGLKGFEEFTDGWAVIFDSQIAFDPWSGAIADVGKTLVAANGLANINKRSSGDGSRNGELFQNIWAGVSSKTYGNLTIGRQNTVNADVVGAYSPNGGSAYAFSPIEFSGVTAGAGDTQMTRLDQSLKYVLPQIGTLPVHVGLIFQPNGATGRTGASEEFNIGATYAGFSIDGVYSHVKDEVSASSLSAAQNVNSAAIPFGTLAATISDNTSYLATAKYTYGPATIMGGFEHIYYANPSHPLSAPFYGTGGIYEYSVVNNAAYNNNKVLSVYWVGGKYQVTPKLQVEGGWYHYSQNSYHGDDGCSTAAFGSCSGQLNAYSLVAEYKFTKRFELYSGIMYSSVANGLASGFKYTNTLDPMVGGVFRF